MANITMREIGSMVGVSAVTVSKALAGRSGVSDEVRKKIVAKAKEMGYRYPSSGNGDGEDKSYDIGILTADRYFDVSAFYSAMYRKVLRQLMEAGHYGILELLTDEDEKALQLPGMIRTGKVDGMIIIGQLDREYLKLIAQIDTPVVFLDFYDAHATASAVVGDNSYGCYRLTNHLIKMGHRDIGFVGELRATTSIMDRYLGFYKSMLSNELPVRPECVISDRDQRGRNITLALPKQLPTAFVCNCDETACRLIMQLKQMGLKVPDDVSVTGFDDFTTGTFENQIALSTFRIDQEEMVQTAIELIIDRCRGDKMTTGRVVVGGAPVYRDSVKQLD